MREFFKGFSLALSMLSTLPFFRVHNFTPGINGFAVLSYPLVGLILGSILYGVALLLAPFVAATHLGIILFSLWVLLTGALHLDGFCDSVDGLYVPKERALEVMKDPHNGGMGMIFRAVFLLLKASSVAHLEALYLLPVLLMLSRLMALLAIYFFPYVGGGMGRLAKEELKGWQVMVALFYTALVVFLTDSWILFGGSIALLLLIKYFFVKRLGGFTGDIYGFTIEVIELLLLNLIIVGLV